MTRFLDGGSEVRFPGDEGYFLPLKRSDPLLGPTQPLGQSVFGRELPGREIDHSHLSIAVIKEWSVTSTPAVYLRDLHRFQVICVS